MPISKPWRKATRTDVKQNVPEAAGVYELKCFGEIVYVGRSRNLQTRLLDHMSWKNPNYYRFKTTGFLSSPEGAEKRHYDKLVDQFGHPPKWNKNTPSGPKGWF